MAKILVSQDLLFEIQDVFGRNIRTTKSIEKYAILIVAVKILNGDGFLVTAYQTKEYKKKGELLWPKQKEK